MSHTRQSSQGSRIKVNNLEYATRKLEAMDSLTMTSDSLLSPFGNDVWSPKNRHARGGFEQCALQSPKIKRCDQSPIRSPKGRTSDMTASFAAADAEFKLNADRSDRKNRRLFFNDKGKRWNEFVLRQREIVTRQNQSHHSRDDVGSLETIKVNTDLAAPMSASPGPSRRASAPHLSLCLSPTGGGSGLRDELESPPLSPNARKMAREHKRANAGLRFHDRTEPLARSEALGDYKYLTARGDVEKLSPRSRYINACFRERLNPRQMLASRISERQLGLQHQGLGNAMCGIFVECFAGMPGVDTVSLEDNNLSDAGMAPVVGHLSALRRLQELDLSCNAMGPLAAQALATWLKEAACPLERLRLSSCGLEDAQCQVIVHGLAEACARATGAMRKLDISRNKLGASDLQCASGLDAGAAIAEWLSSSFCTVQELDLSWNNLRRCGAEKLCQSLAANTSLLTLDLSYNALGQVGGLALGAAIIDNATLTSLNVAHSGLNSTAAFTLLVGVCESRALQRLVLDGNPIGRGGLTAMMVVPLVRGTGVDISAQQCNVSGGDDGHWFNAEKLQGLYILRMNNSYERAIALMLLRLVAFHRSCRFTNCKYDSSGKHLTTENLINQASPDKRSPTKSSPDKAKARVLPPLVSVDLVTVLLDQSCQLNEAQREIASNFEKLIAASDNGIKAVQAFQEADLDGNGGLDREEVCALLKTLGIELSPFRLGSLMATFDSDGNGAIDFEEFQHMLAATRADYQRHLSDLRCVPATAANMATFSVIGKSQLQADLDAEWGASRFVPQRTGSLLLEVVDGRIHKDLCHTLASCNRAVLEQMAAKTPDPELANQIGRKLTQIRVDDAVVIAREMSRADRSKNETLVQLMQQMASVEDCRLLISEVVGGDRVEKAKLRRELGHTWHTAQGMLNGFYELDLDRPLDRECLCTLFAVSKIQNDRRASRSPLACGLIGDISQKGNWSCFRNELFNGYPIVINDEFVDNLPAVGRVQFDFSGEDAPLETEGGAEGVASVQVMKDAAIVKMLVQLQLVRPDDADSSLAVLEEARRRCDECQQGDGNTVFEAPLAAAQEAGMHRSLFFENLGRRSALLKRAARLEDIATAAPTRRYGSGSTDSGLSTPSSTLSGSSFGSRTYPTKSRGDRASFSSPETKVGPRRSNSLALKSKPTGSGAASDPRRSSSVCSTPDWASQGPSTSTSGDSPDAFELPILRLFPQVQEPAPDEGRCSGNDPANVDKHLFNATEGQHFYGVVKPLTRTESQAYLRTVSANDCITPQAKMRRLVDAVEEALGCYKYIRARHLALLLACVASLPQGYGMCEKTKFFGNYRVDLVVMLFGHIVDRHNFCLVLKELTPFETACVSLRVGMLSYFNPMRPEGSISLDLSRWEQRQLAKAYTMLETHEPGENWTFKAFRWTIDSPNIPGWVLTTGWVDEAAMPARGILELTYYSGEGQRRNKCAPVVEFRKALLHLTALEEYQFRPERSSAPAPSQEEEGDAAVGTDGGAGLACLLAEESLWRDYLGGTSDPACARSVHAPRRKTKTKSGEASIPAFNLFTTSKFVPDAAKGEVLPVNGSLATGKTVAALAPVVLAPLKANSNSAVSALVHSSIPAGAKAQARRSLQLDGKVSALAGGGSASVRASTGNLHSRTAAPSTYYSQRSQRSSNLRTSRSGAALQRSDLQRARGASL